MKSLDDIDYYFITDAKLTRKDIFADVECALAAGCRIVQYREKNKSREEMIKEAGRVRELCGDHALFIVNDYVDIALAVDADGVHVGQEDLGAAAARRLLGDRVLGVTVHNLGEALDAVDAGADYLGVSPIYPTNTKADAGGACGVRLIEQIRGEGISLPIVAIGGITKGNVADVIRAGADSVAAISAVVCSGNVEKEVRDFIRVIHENR